ncbi:MAG: acyl-CoA dehydrogenase, partial [Pseudomonas sp.]|nr:acyl-CoA dehydrogenase [Pseudomonas sp.]
KMGYRGTTSTMLNFGEKGGAVGYLVGEPHQGLAQMFHMMNEARIGVGLGSVMLGYTGYLHALEYARERRQGRPLKERDPASPMIPLIEHADVRRMLLAQKAFVEGGLALCLFTSTLIDEKKHADDPSVREEAAGLNDLLTPIVKSWPSQFCLEANSLAIQVHGGYGYTREYPVEQFYRDNRLNPIHEGTHGIQGQDLLGRKVAMQDGRFYQALLGRIRATLDSCGSATELAAQAKLLSDALATLEEVTDALQALRKSDPERALANAYLYMECFGHVVVGWLWLRQAETALKGLQQGGERPKAFYQGKLAACEYFLRYELPKPLALAAVLRDADRTTLDMPAECF